MYFIFHFFLPYIFHLNFTLAQPESGDPFTRVVPSSNPTLRKKKYLFIYLLFLFF